MLKAILLIMLVHNADGTVHEAIPVGLDSCKTESVQAVLEKLPKIPEGDRVEFTCVEPGPAKTDAFIGL